MKYKFLGKPDRRFPFLKTGKIYDLEIEEHNGKPMIVYPFICPYSNWKMFYKNWRLVFRQEDLIRLKIKWWEYPILWFLPTYIQISEGLIFYYKIWREKIYVMKIEKLKV